MTLLSESKHDICKQVYNCLAIDKGTFIFNRDIGSNIAQIDINSDNAEKTCELMVKAALLQVPQVVYEGCVLTKESSTSYTVSVMFGYLGDSYETEVKIFG